MEWLIVPGLGIILFTLRQVFQDLFHPSESGSLSEFVARRTFNTLRRYPKLLPDAGPLAIILVIFSWVILIWVGFALMYWPLAPGSFRIEGGKSRMSFAEVLYFSLEVLTTLGLGDIAPLSTAARMISVVHALLGFAILTASISSVVLIHQTLARQRSLARRISLLCRSDEQNDEPFSPTVVYQLAFDLARTQVDLVHFPIVYYFHAPERDASLAFALGWLVRLNEKALAGENVDGSRKILRHALDDLTELLDRKFLHTNARNTAAVISAYAHHHLAENAQEEAR